MSIFNALEAAKTHEVTAGGLRWRIKRINSRVASDLKFRMLAVAIPAAEDLAQELAAAELPEAERHAYLQQQTGRKMLKMLQDSGTAVRQWEHDVAILKSGTVALWDEEGAKWFPVRLVDDGEIVEGVGDQPTLLPVDTLPPGAFTDLSAAIWAHSTDQGAASERIKSFRVGPGDGAGA